MTTVTYRVETPGIYHVSIELASGATHRYAIGATSADDALEHVESFCLPRDYPRQAYIVLDSRLVRAEEEA